MTYTPKHLRRWTLPACYVGAKWPDYFSSGFGRSRDSECLEESNFQAACEALLPLSTDAAPVHPVQESHWAVGWVEWIAIHKDNAPALQAADALRARYEQYPSLDDDRLSMLEIDTANEAWANTSLRERIALCASDGISIFAARHDYIPQGESGRIVERLVRP